LGLNIGSAVRNLTQGVNTYAELGEKYTAIGYMKTLRELFTRTGELEEVGVLRDNFIQDREISSVKSVMEKLDKGLWVFFNIAEKINRGAAYYGAKARAIANGASEKEAVKQGLDTARDTQFTFGSVDTPVALQSDLIKTFAQFQSFNVKQTEFLSEMANKKKYAGLIRWLGANALIIATVGKLFGYDAKNAIPFSGVLTGETKLGSTPPVQLGTTIMQSILGSPDKYGKVPDLKKKLSNIFDKIIPFVPAGVQIKKTAGTLEAILNGGKVTSASGKTVNFKIDPKDLSEVVRGLIFGKYQTEAGQAYLDRSSGKPKPKTGRYSDIKPR